MRHRKRTAKLGRTSEHRNLMLSNLVCSLILHGRITTTLAKARAARSVAEKMVTLGKSGSLHDQRLAVSRLHQEDAVHALFHDIAPLHKERHGGYTRIIKMHQRRGDASSLAILEWVEETVTEKPRKKRAPKAASSKPATASKEASAPKPEEPQAAQPGETAPEPKGSDAASEATEPPKA